MPIKNKQKKNYTDSLILGTKAGREMIDLVLKEVKAQQKELKLDLYDSDKDEVLNGLFFRNLRFFHSSVISFHFWAEDLFEIIYRMMLESFIYLSYLTKSNNKDLYKEFIKYGIGQDKLYKLHLARLIEENKIQKTDSLIEYINSGSDIEIWDELVSVKLKNFEDIRKISKEIGLEDLYAIKYQPYSVTAHGHWSALKKYYLKECKNPLHRLHLIGNSIMPPLNPSTTFELTQLFYDSYKIWINEYQLPDKIEIILQTYLSNMNNIFGVPNNIKYNKPMLTQDEENYLSKIDPNKKASVKPFDPKAKETGDTIVLKIKKECPDTEVLFMGATALGIAGQNDIDIYALSDPKDFDKYLPTFEKLFGKPLSVHETFIEWDFNENSYSIELYLTDPSSSSMQKQIKVFNILKSNKELLKEYENLKLKFDGKSFRDYQKAKYEFYSEILNNGIF